MLLKNVQWISESGKLSRGNILIKNGKISQLVPIFNSSDPNSSFSENSFLFLPGFIDPHVHFRQPGQFYKEGIKNGAKAALAGGVTTVLDMPNNQPPCENREVFNIKRKLFEKNSLVNWGLHVLDGKFFQQETPKVSFASIKVFFSKSGKAQIIHSSEELTDLFEKYKSVSIHVEDESCFIQNFQDHSGPPLPHHESRPREAIISGLKRLDKAIKIFFSRNSGKKLPRIVLLHLSTEEEVHWLNSRKKQGLDIWGETSPHYLFYTYKDVESSKNLLKVNPPIRDERDRQALREAVKNKLIDFIGSDHAPHALKEKLSPTPPSGIPGIEHFGPLLLQLLEEGLIDWSRLLELGCKKAANCYSIKGRDGIKETNFADLVLYSRAPSVRDSSPNKNTVSKVFENRLVTKAGYNPYPDIQFIWKVEEVFVNGVQSFSQNFENVGECVSPDNPHKIFIWANSINSKEVYENNRFF
ncbi:MAG: dihydroorotase family protein [Candidatus Riflebacteria bacterium]|nr:dihydroorotase family protein [Candidatus Riflebacteria bacterium]